MRHPIIAIGLDSADPEVLEAWMDQGYLPTLNRLRQQGIYSRLRNLVPYCDVPTPASCTELAWVSFLTGCLPQKSHYWDVIKFDNDCYGIDYDLVDSGYDYQDYPPFYALGDDYQVIVFDPPVARLSKQASGLQMLGWGGHFPFSPSESHPSELWAEIEQTYGKNPVLFKDHGYFWKPAYVRWLTQAVHASIETREAICQDLMQRQPWDLFMTVFGEYHSAAHSLVHLSQPNHPLYADYGKPGQDPLREVFVAIDQAIARILAQAPEPAYILCYSVHGMTANYTDLPSMLFLPELLYRYNFPGKVALKSGSLGHPPQPPITHPLRNTWAGAVWSQKNDTHPLRRWLRPWLPARFLNSDGPDDLISPYELHAQGSLLSYMPALWFSSLWPRMKAFALPSFSDGSIRINLKGREVQGIVEPEDYDALCAELTALVQDIKDARTGKPMVKSVTRTRRSPLDRDPALPDSDLVVEWCEQLTDVVDSPQLGRVGPVPYGRTGGHREQGFMILQGPGIQPSERLTSTPQSLDLAPTILSLLGAPIPDYMDGKPLVNVYAHDQL